MKVFLIGNVAAPDAPEVFSDAEAQLTTAGHTVLNPLRNELPSDSPDELKAAVNVMQVISAEAAYLIPGWKGNTLAVIEKNIAVFTGKTILQEDQPDERDEIRLAIQTAMGVSFDEIRGRSRNRIIIYARQIYAHHARKTGASLTELGNEMEHNHTSALYYLNNYATDYAYTPEFRKYADAVEAALNGKPIA